MRQQFWFFVNREKIAQTYDPLHHKYVLVNANTTGSIFSYQFITLEDLHTIAAVGVHTSTLYTAYANTELF